MELYTVKLTGTYSYTMEIVAGSEDEAKDKARENIINVDLADMEHDLEEVKIVESEYDNVEEWNFYEATSYRID